MLKKLYVLPFLLCATQSFAQSVCPNMETGLAELIEQSNRLAISYNQCLEKYRSYQNYLGMCSSRLPMNPLESPQAFNQRQIYICKNIIRRY